MDRLRRIIPYLAGLGLSLYLTRVAAEATRVAWSLPALLALTIIAAAAGLALARFLTWQPHIRPIAGLQIRPGPQERAARRARPPALWIALPLWLYVLWPRQDPTVAWGVGLTVLIAGLLQWKWDTKPRQFTNLQITNLPTFIFATALLLYALTLSPGLQPADGGEFQLVAARFGVAHPPGYPLYSTLGGLFVRLPLGPGPAWRLNLFSALTAAATLALVGSTARRMTRSSAAGLVAALTLGSATTFWATATAASIRPLTAFFTALVFYALTAPSFKLHVPPVAQLWGPGSRFTLRVRRPTLFALALGLGVTHHASLVFIGAVGLAYLLLVDPSLLRQPRRWLTPATALALTQLVWLYLPLRDAANAPLAPGNLTTLKGLMDHILARGFAGDMFAFATPEHLPDRLSLLPTLLRFQFNPLLLGAALLGALLLLRRDRCQFLLLVGGFALHTFVTLTYRAPQTVEYEMPAYIALALLAGETAGGRRPKVSRWRLTTSARWLLLAVTLTAGILTAAARWPSFRTLARQEDTRKYSEALLEAAPDGAAVLSNWHWATPAWYLQQVEGMRPDITVKYVAPQGPSLAQNWVDEITARVDRQPVVVVRYFGPEYGGLPYRFAPLGPAFVVQSPSQKPLPASLTPLNVDLAGQIRLLGYRLDADQLLLSAGRPLPLTLAWTPLVPLERDVALFAHLLREGQLVGQGIDQRHTTANYAVGQVILDRFLLYPLSGAMPGPVELVVGAYEPGEGRLISSTGADHVPLTTISLQAAQFAPVTRRPMRIPFVSGPTLVGLDWDTTLADQWRLYLHWQAGPHPTTLDTAIYRQGQLLAQAQVHMSQAGYLSSVYDLPANTGPLVLETNARSLGAWGLTHDQLPLPDPDLGERYVPLGNEMVLMEAKANNGENLSGGASLRYDLRLVATRPLLRDRILSVSLVGLNPAGSWAWRELSDGVPALGALPTFKWIHNSTALDRHRLTLPTDVPAGVALAQLQVYDHFTQTILPPLDARLLRQGVSVPLNTWAIVTNSAE